MATPTPTSGTAATSSPVSELDRCCSARVSSSHGTVISTAVKTSSRGQRASTGRTQPRGERDGQQQQAPSAVRAKTSVSGLSSSTAILISRYGMPQAMDSPANSRAARRLMAQFSAPAKIQSIYYSCMSTLSRDFTIDLRRLRVLRMLDQHGTVSAAATALHLTPSAVSQQIAGLARDTGVQLLEKRGRGVRLTARARRLLEHAAVIEQQLQVARADLASWDAGDAGHVGIASLSTGITAIVAPALKSLRASHPGLSVTVNESEPPQLFTDLELGDVDIAVTVHHTPGPPVTDPRYHRVDLLVDPLDAVLPADHPAAHPDGVRLTDLADQPWVSGYPGGSCARLTEAVCANAGFTPDVRHHVGDWVALGALVASGAGCRAGAPRGPAACRSPGLAVVPVLGTPAARHFYAAVRAGAEADPAHRRSCSTGSRRWPTRGRRALSSRRAWPRGSSRPGRAPRAPGSSSRARAP